MNKQTFDIIIVNYNSTDYLVRCLKSIIADVQDKYANIFVIENSIVNDTHVLLQGFPRTTLIKNTTNVGFAAAINQGIKSSHAEYVILLNPDCYVSSGFLNPLTQYMERHPDVGIVGPKVLDADGSVQGSARAFPTALTALYGRSSPLTRYFPNNPISKANIMTLESDGKTPIAVDWVSGACMLVRRKAIHAVGLMDERFFMYWEDADWCKRMWENGWEVIYFPAASVVHFVGKSSDSRPLRSIYHFHKSSMLLYAKHASFLKAIFNPLVIFLLSLRGLFVACLNISGWRWRKK